jgi:cyanophycin synthetase
VDGGGLWVRTSARAVRLLDDKSLPITLGGSVRFMVENALCAALIASELGLDLEAVRAGLRAIRPDMATSRGRLNRYRLPGGGTAIADFAHNPAGVRGLIGLVQATRPGRVSMLCGLAGDRSDAVADAYADAVSFLAPDRVLLKELPEHQRGRAEGEVPAMIRQRLRDRGMPDAAMVDGPNEVDAASAALDATGPSDLALLLIHEELEGVLAMMVRRGATPDGG